jgi:hypothetical protein
MDCAGGRTRGASLVRPSLAGLQDAVLYYSPNWLARKVAYQALLTEEFALAWTLFGVLNLAGLSRVNFPGDKTA